jgi:hypothetical protein
MALLTVVLLLNSGLEQRARVTVSVETKEGQLMVGQGPALCGLYPKEGRRGALYADPHTNIEDRLGPMTSPVLLAPLKNFVRGPWKDF